MQKIKDWFTKEIMSGVMRHIVSIIAGILIAKGIATHVQIDTVMDLVNDPKAYGALLAVIAIAKSAMQQKSALIDLHAAAATGTLPPGASPLPQSEVLKSPKMSFIAIGFLILFAGFTARAQVPINAPQSQLPATTALAGTNVARVVIALESFWKDVEPYLGTNVAATAFGGGLYNKGSYGYFGGVEFPTTMNNINYGFCVVRLRGETYYGPLAITLGKTITVPYFKWSFYAFATESALLQFDQGDTLRNEAMAGARKTWKINEKANLTLAGLTGKISGVEGSIYGLTLAGTWKF